jgi:hypothetical protein
MKVTRRNSSHGNFHFYPNDLIKLQKVAGITPARFAST